jgi:hypothetical protein
MEVMLPPTPCVGSCRVWKQNTKVQIVWASFVRLKEYITDLRRRKENWTVPGTRMCCPRKIWWTTWMHCTTGMAPACISVTTKDKRLWIIREQTSSEALSTFTYAACAESNPQRSHCPVVVGDPGFNSDLLKRPDLKFDEANLLDSYKWLHPDCVPPPVPVDEGTLHGHSWIKRRAIVKFLTQTWQSRWHVQRGGGCTSFMSQRFEWKRTATRNL